MYSKSSAATSRRLNYKAVLPGPPHERAAYFSKSWSSSKRPERWISRRSASCSCVMLVAARPTVLAVPHPARARHRCRASTSQASPPFRIEAPQRSVIHRLVTLLPRNNRVSAGTRGHVFPLSLDRPYVLRQIPAKRTPNLVVLLYAQLASFRRVVLAAQPSTLEHRKTRTERDQ